MPVNQKVLLSDCQKQLKLLEADLRTQADALPDLNASLRAEWAAAREAGRVGDAFEIWRSEQATQAAVHWVLGCVFVRFLEDNALVDPLVAGAGDRGRLAEATEQAFYGEHPTLHERDWLRHAFESVAALSGGAALFDRRHNPLFRWDPTPDAAKGFVQFWRRPDPNTGEPMHDFTDPSWDTRFLGDLYQDLSESARKKYALLQTPVFVEEFILDRTLGEALKELPLAKVTVIDPTCGSGHFLLGAFSRLLAAWEANEPGALREELAQRALDRVAGVDLNPFAVAIARFRLLIAALRACNVSRLERAPAFRLHIAVGDSLLHGDEPGQLELGDGGRGRYVRHAFSDEDLAEVNAILGLRYMVVVGNPPYIAPSDSALNTAYRERYTTCYRQYGLSVPFVERFWQIAKASEGDVAGWIGMINSDAFMRRRFGKLLIEQFFPRVDLTHVVQSSGVGIPGGGVTTVILFGRGRGPATNEVRVAVNLAGDPPGIADPATGPTWQFLLDHLDEPGSLAHQMAILDMPRGDLASHPWSLSAGAGADLKEVIAAESRSTLATIASSIGFYQDTHADTAFVQPTRFFERLGLVDEGVRPQVRGDDIREWSARGTESIVFPFDNELKEWRNFPRDPRWAWFHALRTVLWERSTFSGKTYREEGRSWFEYHQFPKDRARERRAIAYAFFATHNHFALDSIGTLFNRSAPVIKLASGSSDEDYFHALGLLNSSVTGFWLRQRAHNKGSTVDQAGARQTTAAFENFFEYATSVVGSVPVVQRGLAPLAAEIDRNTRLRDALLPAADSGRNVPSRTSLDASRALATRYFEVTIALQEELDWLCYNLYDITTEALTHRDGAEGPSSPPPLKLGERAFEIVLARRVAAGEEKTTWFERHGSTPITELPSHWRDDYKALIERRIALIESDRNIGLIERPEYKRRWNVETWETLEKEALGSWLLDRLESPAYWPDVAFQTTRDLAARAATDPEFGQVATLWAGAEGVALEAVIRELALGECVPFLPALRYTESGREKRRVWENTWDMQRKEDAIDAVVASQLSKRDGESDDAFAKRLAAAQKLRKEAELGVIPRPPKYASADFQRAEFWRMRGALDVPKERFILYAFLNRDGDDAPLLGWAGWSYLQQAQALAAWYTDRTQHDGWQGERLVPLLAGMAELVPWLLQWHNELDPMYGARPGDAYASWLDETLQSQGITRAALDAWDPPRTPRRGGRRRA